MRVGYALLSLLLLCASVFAALPDQFSGDGLTVRFTNKAENDLRGTLELGGKQYPFTAARSGDSAMAGTFTANGQAYKFTLTADGQGAILETDGAKYRVTPGGAAPQPPGNDRPNPGPAQPAGPASDLTFTPTKIVDPKTNLAVCYLLAPKGWQIEPGILWRPMDAQFVSSQLTIWDEKTGWCVRWIPHDQFSCSPVLFDTAIRQGNKPRSIGGIEYTRELPNAQQYIQSIILPRYRNMPEIKVTASQDLPELAKLIDQSQPFTRQLYATGGRELQYSAARVRIEYPARNKVMMEEEILCVLNISWSPRDHANARQVGVQGEYFFTPDRVYGISAPKGQLEQAIPLLQTTVLSVRPDETWMKFIDNIQGAVTAIVNDQYKLEEAARRQITESQRKTVEASWKSADQQSREVGALISGTQARQNPNNPNGPPVSGPAGKKSWTNPKGEWKHLEPNDDPNTHPGSSKDWVEAKNATN